jgi:hypothetical protein
MLLPKLSGCWLLPQLSFFDHLSGDSEDGQVFTLAVPRHVYEIS